MKPLSSVLRIALTTLIIGALCVSTSYAQKGGKPGGGGGTSAPYTLVDLKGFTVTYSGGTLIQSNAAAVNEPDGAGTVQVVGSSVFQLGNYSDYQIHPVLWEVNSDASFARIDLGLPPQSYQAYAIDINDLGVVTIDVGGTLDGTWPSWISVPSEPLQKLPSTSNTSTHGLNNLNEIVGRSDHLGASLWQPTAGTLGNPVKLSGIQAIGISDTGLMVGHDGQGGFGQNPWKDYEGGRLPTFAWFDNGGVLHVEPIPQPETPNGFPLEGSATAISSNGEWIAGYIVRYVSYRWEAQAFKWSVATGMVLLDPLAGTDCVAVAVNNDGDVVGWSDSGDRNNPVTACLWQGGQAYQLNVLAGAGRSTNLVTACSINDAGHIVGYMDLKTKRGNETHAFALVPNQ